MHGQENITFIFVTEKGCIFWKSNYYMRKANVCSSVVMVGMEGALALVLQLYLLTYLLHGAESFLRS